MESNGCIVIFLTGAGIISSGNWMSLVSVPTFAKKRVSWFLTLITDPKKFWKKTLEKNHKESKNNRYWEAVFVGSNSFRFIPPRKDTQEIKGILSPRTTHTRRSLLRTTVFSAKHNHVLQSCESMYTIKTNGELLSK